MKLIRTLCGVCADGTRTIYILHISLPCIHPSITLIKNFEPSFISTTSPEYPAQTPGSSYRITSASGISELCNALMIISSISLCVVIVITFLQHSESINRCRPLDMMKESCAFDLICWRFWMLRVCILCHVIILHLDHSYFFPE